ncbi:IMPACT family protein [Sanguibacter massiliensis]|uniref:IMPACT family protein n=1 Tax=Sanguibacter massiliensis TaxID=1973217 RepID=UPI001F5E2BDB|nr:YigZ family protein [Sanguibacter massiliensis]
MSNADDPARRAAALPSTVAGTTLDELVIKKSRFLTRIVHVTTVEDADAVVAAARKELWDARHHCVAMVLGTHADQQRSTDDGEPSGTAGVPMLEVLRHRGLTDVVAVVTRYFGGVLLGAGGLVRAYSGAVAQALDLAPLVRRSVLVELLVAVPFADAGRVEHVLRTWVAAHDSVLDDVSYGADASFTVLVPPHLRTTFDADLAATTAGSVEAIELGTRIASIPA